MFANLPEEIINKIIMESIPEYNYMSELKQINKFVGDDTTIGTLMMEVRKRIEPRCNCGDCVEKPWYAFYYNLRYAENHVCHCPCCNCCDSDGDFSYYGDGDE